MVKAVTRAGPLAGATCARCALIQSEHTVEASEVDPVHQLLNCARIQRGNDVTRHEGQRAERSAPGNTSFASPEEIYCHTIDRRHARAAD